MPSRTSTWTRRSRSPDASAPARGPDAPGRAVDRRPEVDWAAGLPAPAPAPRYGTGAPWRVPTSRSRTSSTNEEHGVQHHDRPETPEPIDRVVIRFAGDSGDGMQLDRRPLHQTSAPSSATTSPPSPTSRPRSVRPAGTLAGVSAFQVHISDHDILDAGRLAERARRDEPGGAQGQHRRACPRARPSSSTSTPSRSATWRRPATRPTRSRTARSPATRSTRCR